MASGNEAATAWPCSTERAEFTTTPAPMAAKDRATASPMPLLDPVTMTTWAGSGVDVTAAPGPSWPTTADPVAATIRSFPVRSALGGQVIGSMATARRRRDTSPRVSPV